VSQVSNLRGASRFRRPADLEIGDTAGLEACATSELELRRPAAAVDKVVAQISKSAVSQVSNLRGPSRFRRPADWEIGDTAGLEACATSELELRRPAAAVDKVVAQISKSAVSQVSNLRGRNRFRRPADWEIGDTAGLEACATSELELARPAAAVDKVVAQISKSAVSQVSNLRGPSSFRRPADLEIGDTAGLEACATSR
jgi:hypothetical protein